MNKFTRFTLFAGLMAFGLAACGDDVQVIDPPPPPPDPLVVALQPGSATINVGETLDIAVNVSGGEASVTPTITCSASNSAVTVTTVGSICRVVGVTEGGNATVTVAVTRGTQSATAGAVIEVAEDLDVPATVAIKSVTQGGLQFPVQLNSIRRQIEVTLTISPGTEDIEEVTLNFRGEKVAGQEFGPGQVAALLAAAAAAAAEQVVSPAFDVTLSWETDAYSVAAVGGAVTGASVATPNHLNGTGPLQAVLDVDDGTETGTATNSAAEQLTLRNLNGFHLQLARTGSTRTALDVQNFEWRGGIDSAGNVNAGVDAALVPVLYTPGVTLASAQFVFAGLLRVLTAAPWTYVWSPAALAGYSMPLATVAWPNQLRDGEYPQVVGNAVLSDGQGMGPFGGALDCTGGIGVPGLPIGILNIEISSTLLCPGGTNWSPPSATLVAAANTALDPLRSGERVDNAAPQGQTFTLSSRPGLPNWPQVPSTGLPADIGGLVSSAGTWINEGLSFSNGGIHNKSAMIDGLDPFGAVSGVSRVVAGFPAPTFLASTYMASGGALGAGVDITANPTGASLPETITPSVYTVMTVDADELDNRALTTLSGNAGAVLLGTDWVDPFLQHTAGISNPDRDAFDLMTAGAGSGAVGDDLTVSDYNYFVNWTDPINTGSSGFTAFAGNPVWRHVHRVTSAGTAVVVGGSSGSNVTVAPAFSTATGLLNYGRTGASQQAVTGLSIVNGYYVFRSYVLDDAGNNSVDVVFPAAGGVVSQESAAIRRQVAVDNVQSTVFGITSNPLMPGGSSVTFTSNSLDNLDLGASFLSLDYVPFALAGTTYWTANSALAVDAQTPGGYYTPAQTLAPIEGTTGGVRHNGADAEHGVIFNTPFETAASIVTTAALTRTVTGFIRSIEWVCSGAGTPIASCPAAPADWASDIAVNLTNTPAAVGWFSPNPAGPGDAPDLAYAAGRPMLASFSQFDATRFDHVPRTSGNVNYFLEQIGATDATSPFPHRSVSVAAINPVSVALNGGLGTEESPYHNTGALQVGWALRNVTATYGSTGVTNLPAPRGAAATVPGLGGGRTLTVTATARLITASTIIPGGPGQNLFPGPLGRVDFFALERSTGTLRYLGSQTNPVVFENNPACVTNTMVTQANYRCWDFTMSASVPNWVGAGANDPVQILAIGVNAAGDGLATFPVDAS